ncbi:MAG TPA: hypothetical protein VK492_12785 [Chitinophagaceae bacterium]|nr:hypothetical protein [Chitinophagaceae bacterium]
MKKLLLLLAFFPLLIQAQSIKAKLGTGGSFIILNNGTPGVDEFVKLLIKETGEVNWYLDGKDLFIRDGFFDAFGDGIHYKYDFMHIDGTTGRIGFNILGGKSDGSLGGENNLPLTSSVTLMGSIATKVRLLGEISNYVIQQDDHIMIIDKTTNTNSDMVLSPVATSRGREYIFKRNDNGEGKIIVKPALGEKLNGIVNGSITLGAENSTLEVVCGVDSWWVISETAVTALSQVTTTSITASDKNIIEVNFTGASQSIDISLPAAADHEDKLYTIKRNANGALFSGNVLRIVPASGENLDQSTFASPYLMENDFESITVRSNGTSWVILNKYKPEHAIREVSTTATISSSDQTLLIPGTSTINLTLPDITTVPVGKTITVKRKAGGAGVVTLLKSGVAVEGAASLAIDGTTLSTVTVQSDGVEWWVISKF